MEAQSGFPAALCLPVALSHSGSIVPHSPIQPVLFHLLPSRAPTESLSVLVRGAPLFSGWAQECLSQAQLSSIHQLCLTTGFTLLC